MVSTVIPKIAMIEDPKTKSYKTEITMVLFMDGTGEGDEKKLTEQRDKLYGAALANREMLDIVTKIDGESDIEKKKIIQQFDALKMLKPSELNKEQTRGYFGALESAKTQAGLFRQANLPPIDKRISFGKFKSNFTLRKENLKAIETAGNKK
jgi:hypothetical protein